MNEDLEKEWNLQGTTMSLILQISLGESNRRVCVCVLESRRDNKAWEKGHG